ncbi:hypothetical protein WN48_05530 [Eufriesea mexicana]|uniref:Uncharacterized protein n=1 Tax=Eufriesea mexicana TaxID=516756 RepID=A0A310SPN1_9HYME|nr:hypothetical protein WN48_05530 [Eufriesea mexicana]
MGRQARSCNDSDCRAHPPVVCTDWHPGRLRSTDPRITPDASPAREPSEISMHDEIDSGRNECRRRAVRMTYETRSCRVHETNLAIFLGKRAHCASWFVKGSSAAGKKDDLLERAGLVPVLGDGAVGINQRTKLAVIFTAAGSILHAVLRSLSQRYRCTCTSVDRHRWQESIKIGDSSTWWIGARGERVEGVQTFKWGKREPLSRNCRSLEVSSYSADVTGASGLP